jgi:hypothetical protein
MDNKIAIREEYTKAVQELNLKERELREAERICDQKREATLAAAGRAMDLLMKLNDDGE